MALSVPSPNATLASRFLAILTYDFKEADRYVEWIWSPLGSLLIAAGASLLGGFFLHPHCFIVFWIVAAMLVVGAVWPWVALAGVKGSLSFPQSRCRESDHVELTIQVKSLLPWGSWGIMILGLKDEGVTAEVSGQGLPYLPGGRTLSRSWSFTPPMRGVYPKGQVVLACGFPFGLWLARRPLKVSGELLVGPRTYPVSALPEEASEQDRDRGVYRDQPGTLGDILGVRPYRRGDPLRRIHWPQSARHDRLIVCERQSAALPTVRVILDLNPESHRGSGRDSSLEWAIRVAASFIVGWESEGARIELSAGRVHFPPDAGTIHRRRLLDGLCRLTPADALPLRDQLARPELRNGVTGATVVVTTDLGVKALPVRWQRLGGSRWVVLRADCFAGLCHDHEQHLQLPIRPWLVLTNPEHLPHQLRPEGVGVCRVG